jgi:hypothetical protein
MRWFIRVVTAFFLVALLSQAIRPARTNPPIVPADTLEARLAVPPDVHAILDRACMDCHSNRTVWPWYSEVAPVSWFLVHHVNVGRRELNLSNWAQYPANRAARKLKRSCTEVTLGEMPIWNYVLLHRNAKLSADDVATLCRWAKATSQALGAPSGPASPHR